MFLSPENGERFVKRVVGVPGDRLELVQNRLVVNGVAATYKVGEGATIPGLAGAELAGSVFYEETFAGQRHAVLFSPARPARRSFGPIVVGPGSYFMLGDNRDQSHDSRWFGPVARDRILGRAVAVVASVDLDDSFRPRFGRFFSRLR